MINREVGVGGKLGGGYIDVRRGGSVGNVWDSATSLIPSTWIGHVYLHKNKMGGRRYLLREDTEETTGPDRREATPSLQRYRPKQNAKNGPGGWKRSVRRRRRGSKVEEIAKGRSMNKALGTFGVRGLYGSIFGGPIHSWGWVTRDPGQGWIWLMDVGELAERD